MKIKELLALSVVPIGLFAGQQENTNSATYTMHHTDADHKDAKLHLAMNEEPGIGLTVFGDYLYWKPYFSNLPFAIDYPVTKNGAVDRENAEVNSAGVLVQDFNNVNFAYSGDSAFRIGSHFTSDWQSFGLGVTWTSFHSSDTNYRTNPLALEQGAGAIEDGGTIAPWWESQLVVAGNVSAVNELGVPFTTRASTTIKLDFVDYAVTTDYTPVSWLNLQPSLAIRSMYSSMNYRQVTNRNRNTVDIASATTPPWITTTDNNNQKFNAVGVMAGLQADYQLYEGFKLFTGAQLSYNAGHMKVTRSTDTSWNVSGEPKNFINSGSQKGDQDLVLAVTDFDIGLDYSWVNDENNFGMNFQVAYEMHLLPNYQNFIYQSASMNVTNFQQQAIRYTGDLTIQGLRVRAGFAF